MKNNKETYGEREEFETIFWRVIHNKYIFKLIFHFIETVEWVHYKDYKDFHINNRVKFKNINSLEWMVENKQYELLKCKLKQCEKSNSGGSDDYIEINENGISRLFRKVCGCVGIGGDEISNIFNKETSIELLSDLLSLILKNKKLEIANMNLPLLAIKNNNVIALKLLFNEAHNLYQIYPSDLEWAIRFSSPEIVAEIIHLSSLNKKLITISPETRNKSIELSAQNNIFKNEMLQLILNNTNMYNSTLSNKLNYNIIFKIKSDQIINKLLDLNQFTTENKESNESINKILELNTYIGNKVKDIHKILALESTDNYNKYLSKYNEPIEGYNIMADIIYCLSTSNTSILLYLFSNSKAINFIQENKNEINTTKFELESIPTKEFIDLLFSKPLLNRYCFEKISRSILEAYIKSPDYSVEKDSDLKSNPEHYQLVFYNAFENGNFEILGQIRSINQNWFNEYTSDMVNLKNEVFTNSKHIVKLVGFYKSINFDCFSKESLMKFVDLISISNNEDIGQIPPKSIPFEDEEILIKELVLSIHRCYSNKLQLILNDFNPISILPNEFDQCWNMHIEYGHYLYTKRDICFSVLDQFGNVEKCIQIILYHLNKEIESSQGQNDINFLMYSTIVNYLFKLLISKRSVELNKIFQIKELINTTNEIIKSNGYGIGCTIIIQHSLYHSFFYICIKSIKFQKYLMQLPLKNNIFQSVYYDMNTNEEYDCDLLYEKDIGFILGNNLDHSIFTFDYLFGNDSGSGASFDDILDKLVTQLSNKTTTYTMAGLYKIENNFYCPLTHNSNLLYYLEINRIDLFFKLLDEIQIQLNEKTTGYEIHRDLNKLEFSYGCDYYQQQIFIKGSNIFCFSNSVFFAACIAFENSEQEFQRFISFCGYYSISEFLTDFNALIVNKQYLNHFNQFQQIIKNSKQIQLPSNSKILLLRNYFSLKKMISKNIENGSGFGHNGCFKYNDTINYGLTTNHIIKFGIYLLDVICYDDENLNQLIKLLENEYDGKYSNKFNIALREIILQYTKNVVPSFFNITKSTVDEAIKLGNIGFLKYYYENGTINNNNQELLLNYLKQQLSLHYDYKFVNWLK